MRECEDRIILKPQGISNSPEPIYRLGVVAMNGAIEADIYGNVNSSHITGRRIVNGIGVSVDFSSNAFLTIFFIPSVRKRGYPLNGATRFSHRSRRARRGHDMVIFAKLLGQGV